jgi:hypothetical protein
MYNWIDSCNPKAPRWLSSGSQTTKNVVFCGNNPIQTHLRDQQLQLFKSGARDYKKRFSLCQKLLYETC